MFSLLFMFAFILVRNIPRLGVSDSAYIQFYNNGEGNRLVVLGLYVVPFAGIAFLWYMSATRIMLHELHSSSSEITHWLQLASGVVFICMMFAASASVGATALIGAFSTAPLPSVDVSRALSSAGYGLMFVYGVRAAGMFMIATTRLAGTTGMVPRSLLIPSYALSILLLLSTTFHPSILLVFPGWVALTSIFVLLHAGRPGLRLTHPDAGATSTGSHAPHKE
ncbi:MAG: hypothetical protein ACRDSP_09635 [Pseudonocardiaceae bacterium]